jgi:hypothetical protein
MSFVGNGRELIVQLTHHSMFFMIRWMQGNIQLRSWRVQYKSLYVCVYFQDSTDSISSNHQRTLGEQLQGVLRSHTKDITQARVCAGSNAYMPKLPTYIPSRYGRQPSIGTAAARV